MMLCVVSKKEMPFLLSPIHQSNAQELPKRLSTLLNIIWEKYNFLIAKCRKCDIIFALFKTNKRRDVNVIYNTSLPVIFGVKHYADALWPIVKKRNIQVNTRRNLIEVKADKDIAVFENLDKPEEKFEEQYSLLHVVPPMGTPAELATCRALVNEAGFVEVDKSTMQHIKYKNVFAIGDCSDSPNSKTAAAAGIVIQKCNNQI